MLDSPPIPAALAGEPEVAEGLEELAELEPGAVAVLLMQDEAQVAQGEESSPVARAARWTITDEGSAEWAMRRLASAEQTITQATLLADEWRSRIDGWLADRTRVARNQAAFFAGQLERFALELRAVDERRKSLPLPSGTVRTTRRAAQAVLIDEMAFVAWALRSLEGETLEAVVRTTHKPLVSGIRDVVSLTDHGPVYNGELVPGLVIDQGTVTAKASAS